MAPVTNDVVLLLPGMTLNASVFPDIGLPSITMDFTRLVVSPTGWSEELAAKRMGFYVERLRDRLGGDAIWTGAARHVVVAPIGFVCDHVEVLYDLDVEARRIAEGCGVGFHRARTVCDHPAFIAMLADLVREALPASALPSRGRG